MDSGVSWALAGGAAVVGLWIWIRMSRDRSESTASLRSPDTLRRLVVKHEPVAPPDLTEPVMQDAARELKQVGFREIGILSEKIDGVHYSREFYSADHGTYGSLANFDGKPANWFLTPLSDGTILFTGSTDRDEEQRGGLISRGYGGGITDRLDDHLEALAERAARGASSSARGTMEERLHLVREYYRHYTSAGRSDP